MISRLMNRVAAVPLYLLSALAVIFIAVLTLMPMPVSDAESWFPHSDKVVHFLLFGGLSVVLCFDFGRRARHLTSWIIICAIAVSVVYGALVEVLQGFMGCGRAADVADWWADIAGAVVCAIVFYSLVCTMVKRYVFSFEPICNRKSIPADLQRLYENSFPVEERRPWNDICNRIEDGTGNYNIRAIIYCGKFAGFISWWNLPQAVYIEHFAVCPTMRGRGIGLRAMTAFVEEQQCPVILEVEPAGSNAMADRRIGFYNRCGFISHPEFDYMQPPYSQSLPSVPLMLMTIGADISLADAAESIRTEVYGVKKWD